MSAVQAGRVVEAPRRVILKDIAEEVLVIDTEVQLPPGTERSRADIPEDLKSLFILTDVLDCFLRFLNAVLLTAGVLSEFPLLCLNRL